MMAQLYRTPPKQIAKYLRENGQLETIAANILGRKARKFIIDNMAGAKKSEEAAPAEQKAVPAEEQEEIEEH